MKKILMVVIIVVALAAGALNFHFILLDRSVKVLQKARFSFIDTFVDARGMNKVKLLAKPALVEAGIKEVLKQ
jgi:hypothetical protein